MITQKEIADRLHVSRTTVARALSGKFVSQKTRRMVLNEVRKRGYVQNSAATSLASKRTRTVYAFIVATIDEGYGQQMRDGILEAERIWNGYNFEIKVLFTDITRDRNQCQVQQKQFLDIVENNHVDGVIFCALSKENMDCVTEVCKKKRIPLMTLDMIYINASLCHVGPDYFNLGTYSGAYMAGLMMKRGRILTLSYDEGYEIGAKRLEGFHHKLKEYPDIEFMDIPLPDMIPECYFDILNKYFYEFKPVAIYAPYHADYVGMFLNKNRLQHKIITISNGINEKVEQYLLDGTIDGIVSARPYFLGAVIANNFFKFFYRTTEILMGKIDVACDIYIKENYNRYDKIF